MLPECLGYTDEISGLGMLAVVAAVATLGEQTRGKRMLLFADSNAAAGAGIKALSRIRIISVF